MRTTLHTLRTAAGLTQTELAGRSGVSRQLIGAVEAGRNLPRVDAALALAAALDVDVSALFVVDDEAVDIVSGIVPRDGTLVRASTVGERTVTATARIGPDGWDVADGVVEAGVFRGFDAPRPGPVLAGCEPGLELLERMLRERGIDAVTVGASSAAALDMLDQRRVHGAVVHGPAVHNIQEGTIRIQLVGWRVGLAGPQGAGPSWWSDALAGRSDVVQREDGAGVQRAFLDAIDPGVVVSGPRVSSHLEAARRSVITGLPAVTMEPAALAVGAAFHPLDDHEAQLWVANDWIADPAMVAALDALASTPFQRRLAAVGGYDLSGLGTLVA